MKNSITRSLGVSAVSLLALATQLSAQTSAFTYQGALQQNGQPANGTYDFMFRLLDAETGGSAAPVIPMNPGVGVTNGLFTTGIDFGAENLNGANLWLEIGVRTNGGSAFTTLAPRQLLTSAPYAVRALEATTVPQGTITSAMLADGAVTSEKISPGAVNQLGSPDGSPSSAMQVNTNGLVGIGTDAPTAGLHIATGELIYGSNVRFQARAGVGVLTNHGPATCVAISGTMAALPSYSSSSVLLLDISNPSSPTVLSELRDGQGGFGFLGGAYRALLSPDLLAVSAANDNAVTLIDVSIPSAPVKLADIRDGVGGFDYLAEAGGLARSGNLLAIAAPSDDAVSLVDISDPGSPSLISVIRDGQSGFDLLDRPWRVAFNDHLLAIAAFADNAITIVDTTSPSNPQLVAVIRDGVGGFNRLLGPADVAWSGDTLIVTGRLEGGLTLIDCSNPANPRLLREISHESDGISLDGIWEIAVGGQWIAVTTQNADSVFLFDLSNPDAPDVVGVFRDGQNGLRFLDHPFALAFSGPDLVISSTGPNSGGLTILTPDSQAVGLSVAGRVGIGTPAPASALHVVGSLLVEKAGGIVLGTSSFSAGADSIASGYSSTSIGYNSEAAGDFSTAMGFQARATHKGTFVWADALPVTFESSTNNQVSFRATGGVRIFTGDNPQTGVSLAPNATAWSVISDRAVKKDFAAVDSREVLEKLAVVPVQSWHYQWESADATPHLGPVAQDFKAAFYPGRDDKSITTLEFDGVALAAIQGLNQKLEAELQRRDAENTELKQQNAELLKRLEAIEARIR